MPVLPSPTDLPAPSTADVSSYVIQSNAYTAGGASTGPTLLRRRVLAVICLVGIPLRFLFSCPLITLAVLIIYRFSEGRIYYILSSLFSSLSLVYLAPAWSIGSKLG